MGRCSCWAVDWKCCHRERGKGEVAGLWQSELELEETFCHLHCAATQHNVGEYVWIWVLNLILCSPGWEVCKGSCSAHMDGIVLPHHCYLMMLSWLTLRESPWFQREGQHKTILFRVWGEKAGDNALTKPPCATMYVYALPLTPHHISSASLGGTQAETKIVLQCLWMCLFPAMADLNAARAPLWWLQICTLVSLTPMSSEEPIKIWYTIQLIFTQDYDFFSSQTLLTTEEKKFE